MGTFSSKRRRKEELSLFGRKKRSGSKTGEAQ